LFLKTFNVFQEQKDALSQLWLFVPFLWRVYAPNQPPTHLPIELILIVTVFVISLASLLHIGCSCVTLILVVIGLFDSVAVYEKLRLSQQGIHCCDKAVIFC